MLYDSVCEAVAKIRRTTESSNPFRVCKEKGILVLPQSLGLEADAIKGFYYTRRRIKTITVNSDLPDVIQRIIVAHELGHALHSYLSCRNQPISTSDYVIFVAEVASTCNEVLLMRHLLGKTQDKKERAYLINHFLDQFKGTVYRQTMFAEFELEMGRMSEAGESLTADALCAKYLELNKLYFGPDMVSDDGIALEWARIPHFFYNYYVFQYATGFSAAVAIANRILKEGESAVKDYKRFLSGGCSTDPISLLKIAGVDMSTPQPVNEALSLFGELIDEMEELMK